MKRRRLEGRLEGRLVIASHNPGKVREIADLLAPFGVTAVSAGDLGLPEPEETGASFRENAEIKAVAAARDAALPALGDDSGLVVPALGGDPGIRSARWAGPDRDFGRAMVRVEAALNGQEDRRAHFVCALCLAWPDGARTGGARTGGARTGGGRETFGRETFEGRVDGSLVWPPRGTRGFGYDPIFLPDGREETFGEMDPAEKHAISHRAAAFVNLVDACFRKA